ncbi:hypothetical protein [Streptomyces sp. NPDC002328]|uniref:hypothetical protein n=1 Tax=Streptomyces sp. NPDC002328 TaxID=3364642 RepID=UPI0036BF9905
METFVTVTVIIAMIALGVLLIHRLNSQHSDRIAAFHYGRSGTPVPGPAPSAPRKTGGRTRTTGRRPPRPTRRRTRADPPLAPHT